MTQIMRVSLLCSCLALGACTVGIVQDDFGNAVRTNVAGQIVNPAAPVDRSPLTLNGTRAALQQQRYVTDMVEKPADVGTLNGATGGDSGGGGGGAGGGTGGSAGTGAAAR
jgi:hypothetical protein